MTISGSALHWSEVIKDQYEKTDEEMCVQTMKQMGCLKDGGAVADVERSLSLSGDEKNTTEVKGCALGIHPRHQSFHHCCLYWEVKCLQLHVMYGVMNEGRQGGKLKCGELSEEEEEEEG